MNNKILWKITLLIFITTTFVDAQSIIKRERTGEWENWVEEIPVSGELRVGFVSNYTTENISSKRFYANVPKKHSGNLCAIISSKDGRYRANANYNITNTLPGIHSFEWDSDFFNDLKQDYNSQNLVILCKIAENCSDKGDGYTLASWNKENDDTEAHLMLNSEVKPKLKFDGKSNPQCNCIELTDLAKVSYNYVCSFPKKLLKNTEEITIVQKMYMLDEITYEKIKFPLAN